MIDYDGPTWEPDRMGVQDRHYHPEWSVREAAEAIMARAEPDPPCPHCGAPYPLWASTCVCVDPPDGQRLPR